MIYYLSRVMFTRKLIPRSHSPILPCYNDMCVYVCVGLILLQWVEIRKRKMPFLMVRVCPSHLPPLPSPYSIIYTLSSHALYIDVIYFFII